MIIKEVMTEISKRIRKEYKTTYTDNLIKRYLIKAMSLVFVSDKVSPEDYFGLMYSESVNTSKVFDSPIKAIVSVEGSTGNILYLQKTPEEIAMLAGQRHLQPFKGEVFYSFFGNGIKFYRENEIDFPVTVNLIKYPFDTTDDLYKYYTDNFIELSIRETIKQIIAEIGGLNDSKWISGSNS